jgi:ssDNA-binding Zn-finger/Zn-ribbon topoisomerase 1
MEMIAPMGDLHKCKLCGDLKIRVADGSYPNGNKRWIDPSRSLWSGKTCPDCHRKRAKENAATKRASREV